MLQQLLKPKQKKAEVGNRDTFSIPQIDNTLAKMEQRIKEDSAIKKAAKVVKERVERACGC